MSLEIQQRETEGVVILDCHGRLTAGDAVTAVGIPVSGQSTSVATAEAAAATPGYVAEGSAGQVKFDLKSGKLTFNDQPLENEASLEMQAQCRRVLSGR